MRATLSRSPAITIKNCQKSIPAPEFSATSCLGLRSATPSVNLFTLAQVSRARTSVPWADQWIVVEDLILRERGEPLWPMLWLSYWGHRLVIPRLLFLADARWFSFGSLTWLSLFLQSVHIALLIALAWLLLRRKPPFLFMMAVVVILNLLLSPLQMENFVWGMQTMFPLVFVAATGAFLCLSLGSTSNGGPFFVLCIVLGAISSYTMPNGLLVWPLLLIQASYLQQNRRSWWALAGTGTAVTVSYLWHYATRPELGMGVGGILRHPVDAVTLLCSIVGSPLRLSIVGDIAVGFVLLVITGYIFVHALLLPTRERRWFSALFAVVLFLFLSSFSLVAGRLTIRDLNLASKDFLPSKYFTMICLLWASIALLALSTSQGRKLRARFLCVYGVLFSWLMFANLARQLTAAEDSADVFRGADAVGSALLLDAPDEQLLSVLWPLKQERDERTLFLRQRGLAMFHEPRATWLGKRVSDVFPPAGYGCTGALEKTVSLNGSSWRVSGWAWDDRAARPPDDILLAGATGHIIGLARGGLRHGYFPGFLVEPEAVLPWHARFRRSEWLGYVRFEGDLQRAQVSLYGWFRNEGKLCAIE